MSTTEGHDELSWSQSGTPNEIADILAQFAQELRQGKVSVWRDKEELQLNADSRVEMHVEGHRDEDGRQGLHLLIHWGGGEGPDQTQS